MSVHRHANSNMTSVVEMFQYIKWVHDLHYVKGDHKRVCILLIKFLIFRLTKLFGFRSNQFCCATFLYLLASIILSFIATFNSKVTWCWQLFTYLFTFSQSPVWLLSAKNIVFLTIQWNSKYYLKSNIIDTFKTPNWLHSELRSVLRMCC